MKNKNEKIKSLFDTGSNLTGSLSGAGIGLLVGGPVGALIGAAASPIIVSILQKVGFEMSDKFLAPREYIKIGATFSLASELIAKRLENGDKPREDGFFENKNGERPEAESILEGTLLKSRDEHEEKKLKYYSFFLSNLSFDETISYTKANTILKIAEQLSYRQLCIMAYFSEIERLEMPNWAITFHNSKDVQVYLDFYYELLDLFNKQILKQYDGIGMGVKNGEFSEFGKCLFQLMQLDEILNEDIQNIVDTIEKIDSLNQPNVRHL